MSQKALVVGITNYEPPTPILEAAVAEANNWAALLRTEYGFSNVTVRNEPTATRAAVLNDLDTLLRGAASGDRLVFVFCGHGTIVQTGSSVADEGLVMYHPRDGDPKAATLTDTDLSAVVKRAKPPADAYITIILDCCFAGGFDPVLFAAHFDLDAGADASVSAKPLFVSLLEPTEFLRLNTIHRFGSLWDQGFEFAAIEPLVVAACERGKVAAQLPIVANVAPHLLFSSRAIPALDSKPSQTHQQLVDSINPLSSDQRATLLGSLPRRSHPFLS
jgi:hypothetical protein